VIDTSGAGWRHTGQAQSSQTGQRILEEFYSTLRKKTTKRKPKTKQKQNLKKNLV